MFKKKRLAGWGNYPQEICNVYRPEKLSTHAPIIDSLEHWLPRGMGRSYGDAALQPNATMSTVRLNMMRAFDTAKGTIDVQAGVTLKEVLDIVVPHGWTLAVVPGTQWATVGGCVACNVHGKNHTGVGGFANYIRALSLRLANGQTVVCSADEHSQYFYATCGGMGMTGLIESVTLQLVRSLGSLFEVAVSTHSNIEEVCANFQRELQDGHHVGWINHFSKDLDGVFYRGKPVASEAVLKPQKAYHLPSLPGYRVMLPIASRVMNRLRIAKHSLKKPHYTQDMRDFLFPLDALKNWNIAYGKQGLIQYQCIIPDSSELIDHIKELLYFLQKKRCYSQLVVLKRHVQDSVLLPFGISGMSLAMDFCNSPRTREVLMELTSLVIAMGGRVYLAKDSVITRDHFEAMYGDDIVNWKAVLREMDPEAKIQSLMSKRLGFKDYG